MKLNCDLGESFGAWHMGLDHAVMPFIDQANIACGFHAGDPKVMAQTLLLAKKHQVTIGAHPSYPDLVGFGRRSMACSTDEIRHLLHYQIAALDGMAQIHGMNLVYVKPHGALYNDMMKQEKVREAVMQAIADYPKKLALMLQATPQQALHKAEAEKLTLPLLFEAFADRRYDDNGLLLARNIKGAVLNSSQMLAQVKQLIEQQSITTVSGNLLQLQVDTLCVHGDNQAAIDNIANISQLVHQH